MKKKIKLGIQQRAVEFDRACIDKENRTVALSFSSEAAVERWFGMEILDHNEKSVRLKRLNRGGALLVNHNRDDQVGVVENAEIGSDRKGRAVVRFGRSLRAEEIFQDVQDGIRTNVSFRYAVYKMLLEKEEKNGPSTYRCTDWEPVEISIESIPADISVGVGRAAEDEEAREIEITSTISMEERTMEKCSKCGADLVNGSCLPCARRAEMEGVRAETERTERARIAEIMAIGTRHNLMDLASEYVRDGKPLDAFREAVLAKISNIQPTPGIDGVRDMDAEKPFRSLGEQLQAVAQAGTPGKRIDKRLLNLNSRAATGMSEGVPSDGGFLVQSDFSLSLLDKINETGILAPKCNRVPIGAGSNGLNAPIVEETSRATGSRWGGVQVYRSAEADTQTSKKPKIGLLTLKLEKLMGVAYATEELLQDSSALEAIISQAFREEFGFRIDDEIIRGTGAGQCLGILNAPCLVTQTAEPGQAAATIVAKNVMNMFSRMPARSVPRATWYINQEVWPELFSLHIEVGTGGIPVFLPPTGLAAAPFGMLLGRPIQPIEQCEAKGTVGDIIFADLSQYALIEKDGLSADASIHVRFLYDEMTYRFTLRNNGAPTWKKYLTPYKGSNTVSPFVALATRS